MKKSILSAAALAAVSVFAADPGTVKKEGGVGFRYDDNHPLKVWGEMAAVFDKHHVPLMYAVIFRPDCFNAEEKAFLRSLVKRGHEIMDHTPNHSAFKFVAEDAAKYAGEPWVDHVTEKIVCLKYVRRNDEPAAEKPVAFKADLDGAEVVIPEEFQKYFRPNGQMVYDGKVYAVTQDRRKRGRFTAWTFWGEPVKFKPVKGADVTTASKKFGFAATEAGMSKLAELTAAECKKIGIPVPTAWIQPGGSEAILQADNVRKGYARHGYICAATYQNRANKIYCETNPERCAYAMMWGQLHLDRDPLDKIKTQIADAYAKHQVLFASSHLKPGKGMTWEAFLKVHDELLAWLNEAKIPVRTQSDWARRLYYSKTDPAENIFPAWTADLDKNGRPDGYNKLPPGVTIGANGELTAANRGLVFAVNRLGGLEKGKNTLKFSVKSGKIQVRITFWQRNRRLGKKMTLDGPVSTFPVPAGADFVDIMVFNAGSEPLVLAGASLNATR
ncbi:MAG: hypothetical protein E7055_07340 [Lentisphaerae bacterium]|nr:hypothetical protein [Lentisphaerota bacterium]